MCRNRSVSALLALILFAGPLAAQSQSALDNSDNAKRKRVLVRSLLFPGLGQFGEKQYLKAFLFAGAELACLIGAFHHNQRGNRDYWLYHQAVNESDAVFYRSLTERHDRKRNGFLLAAAGVWAFNLVDALLLANHRYRKRTSGTLRAAIQYYHDTKTLGLDLAFTL